jgi:hypothetical protein
MSLMKVAEHLSAVGQPMSAHALASVLGVKEAQVECWLKHWLRTGLIASVSSNDCHSGGCDDCAFACRTYYQWVG